MSLFPAPLKVRGDAVELQLHEQSRYRAAALHARRVLPGPLGDLVHRELNAYADFGYRFTTDGLIPRLAAEILAMRSNQQDQTPVIGQCRMNDCA